jgi:acyl carrier protein
VIAALTEHPAVAAAAVTAAGRTSAERRLVAHLVAAGDAAPAFGELDAFLSSRLPRHLVPSNYVWRDSLPLTAHGKLDREALARAAEPAPSAAPSPAGPAAVGDTVEGRIATAVAELLDVDEIGRDENFFLRGGHSMLGAQLIVRLEDMFGAEISLRFLFDHPTPAELAREVQRQVGDEESAATVPG